MTIRITWKHAKLLIDTLEPLLFLHTTAALLTFHVKTILIQSECREKRSMFRRTFHLHHDYEMDLDSVDEKSIQQPVRIVINPTAVLNSIHKLAPLVKEILPKALDVCAKQRISMPAELKSATEIDIGNGIEQGSLSTDLTRAKAKEILEVSKIEWKWDQHHRELSQKLNIYKNWQLLPCDVYETSTHRFYDASYEKNHADNDHNNNPDGYRISTHIGPTLHLDFIEMSILSPTECQIQVSPDSFRFVANTTSSSLDKKNLVAEAITQYSHGSDVINKRYWIILPEYLLPDFWERHQYSIHDIYCTLHCIPERLIWQLLIAHHLSPTNAATNVWSDSDGQLICGGKSAAITKLMKHFTDNHKEWKQRTDVTWNMADKKDPNGDGKMYELNKRHVPNLPVHRLSVQSYQHLAANPHQLYSWRGISVVVVEENEERNLLRLKRVIPEAEYKRKFYQVASKEEKENPPSEIKEQPSTIQIDRRCFVLMEESFFFYCNSHNNEENKEKAIDEPSPKRRKVTA